MLQSFLIAEACSFLWNLMLCSSLFQSYIKMTEKIKTKGFVLSISLDTSWCYFFPKEKGFMPKFSLPKE